MTANEAFKKVKESSKELIECCDFGEFYGFIFGSSGESIGTAYICVNKNTGEVFSFSPFDDFELFDKGVQISVQDVLKG